MKLNIDLIWTANASNYYKLYTKTYNKCFLNNFLFLSKIESKIEISLLQILLYIMQLYMFQFLFIIKNFQFNHFRLLLLLLQFHTLLNIVNKNW